MKLAFCLFKYFPFGGLQRDFIRIARECLQRGHLVDVYTYHWEGKLEPGLQIRRIRVNGLSNHSRSQNFVQKLQPLLQQGQYDLVVGFNKMPGLDVYYAADTCYQAKAREKHGWWYRLTRRYRHYVNYEKAVFAPSSHAEILLLSPRQQAEFMHYYATLPSRFHVLPPGIDKDRIAPPNALDIRAAIKSQHGIGDNELLLLMVGSGFKTKGLDRALLGYAALPAQLKQRTWLFVIGKDHAEPFQRQAMRLGIEKRIVFLGGRNDVPAFLLAADLLLHPAYNENTGTVLLEALTSGLPVLTTDVCGYAGYIQQAQAGVVISSPFKQEEFNQTLAEMLLSPSLADWRQNALAFAQQADIYSLPQRAVSIIESVGPA
jgi:UDP-glucose:(heptosyl)LPS alpha-1,3-glucosyltransferase